MIQSIKLDNFKALNGVTIPFTPFTVLIGDNSVGKTTVLQVLAFLKYCCVYSFDSFLSERHLSAADICSKFGSKKTIVFSVNFEFDGKPLQWDISIVRGKDRFALTYEKVFADGQTFLFYTPSANSYRLNAKTGEKDPVMAGSFSCSIIQFTNTEKQAESYPELTNIKKFFANMETLDLLSPYNMKGSSQGVSDVIGLGGEKLGSFIKKLSSDDRYLIAQDVKKFTNHFFAVEPKTKQYGWTHLEAQESYGDKLIDITAANISDGVLRIIAFCSLRFLANNNGAILLDEIEDGINNEHLELLVQILKEIQREKNIQIIATTHNTVLLDYWMSHDESSKDASIIYMGRTSHGDVFAKDIFSVPAIKERLGYMFPGEVVLNMSNRELREAIGPRE